jgi:hypothetical protein
MVNDGQERKTSLISGEEDGILMVMMMMMMTATVNWVYRV